MDLNRLVRSRLFDAGVLYHLAKSGQMMMLDDIVNSGAIKHIVGILASSNKAGKVEAAGLSSFVWSSSRHSSNAGLFVLLTTPIESQTQQHHCAQQTLKDPN